VSTASSPSVFLLGTTLVLGLFAVYSAWRLSLAIRRKLTWHEITARALFFAGVGMFLVARGLELQEEGGVPPADRFPFEYVGVGMFLSGLILSGLKPRSPVQRQGSGGVRDSER